MNAFISKTVRWLLLPFLTGTAGFSQRVENRGCPDNYFRNNGNGQSVTVFAANILSTSIYFQNALKSGNQGNFTFKWGTNIVNPPVITKTWVTSTSGVTTQNWEFGNNTTGSPFNPPEVPSQGEVRYTFYYNNLPNAGVVTLELRDPFDSSYIKTCSYQLTSGSSSSGSLISYAIAPPKDFIYPANNAAVLYSIAGNSEQPSINAGGGSITYTMDPQVSGVSIHPASGIVSWNSAVPKGEYHFTCKASNGLQPDATASFNLIVTESGVVSGVDGGLESKSLGNAVAERVYHKKVQSESATINYQSLPTLFNQVSTISPQVNTTVPPQKTTGINAQVKASRYMPDQQVLGKNFTGYITSPTDIISFTNAADVVSVDYVEAGLNKAVAFCTKTINGIYTHTKPVCDRLKGSELLAVDTINMNTYTFLLYQLKPLNGLQEYAISFSAGYNRNDNIYTLQSEWTTDRYIAQDTVYNFQLWSADSVLLKAMLKNVLQKLNSDMKVVQTGSTKKPVTYITKAQRDKQNQLNLQLTIANQTANTTGLVYVTGKANEQVTTALTRSYPVTLTANGTSNIIIPVKDMAEAEIRLLVNGTQEDFVYSNDGVWNLYKTPATQVAEFVINNDTLQPNIDVYRLFRNVQLRATTPDYVTVYRMIKGGGVAADLSGYKAFRFSARGTGMVRIRLTKKSINNFDEQYEYSLPLEDQEKEYNIPISAFVSKGKNSGIELNDLLVASFTYEATSGIRHINASLSNVRFTKEVPGVAAEVSSILAFPNPVTTEVKYFFQSVADDNLTIQLIGTGNGKLCQQHTIPVRKGQNQYTMKLSDNLPAGIYLVNMFSAIQKMQTKILRIK